MNIRSNQAQRKGASSIGVLAFFLLLTLFLESEDFIISSPLGRMRPNLLFIITIGFFCFFLVLSNLKNKTWKVNKAFALLFLFFIVNIVSLFFADFSDPLRFEMGAKILFLYACWLVVFYFIEYICSVPERALTFIKILFLMGFLETLVGTSEMIAALAKGNFYRPDGTISNGDADFYAILLMAFLISMVVLRILKVTVISKKFDSFFIFLLALNVFLSFVRSAWGGFIIAMLFLFFLEFINAFGEKKKEDKVAGKIIFSLLLVAIFVLGIYYVFLSANLQEFALNRLTVPTTDEGDIGGTTGTRLLLMAESFSYFLQSPIIGNGPSAFSLQGLLMEEIPWRGDTAFDPSIITTVLNDTGIIGGVVFIWFIVSIFKYVFHMYRKDQNNILMKYSFAFSITIFGLLVSYVPTTALWFPFSWVFFSLPTALALASRKVTIQELK